MMHAHASRFQKGKTYFLEQEKNWILKGARHEQEADQKHQIECTEQCPKKARNMSIFHHFFMFLSNIPLRPHAQRKQDRIPFQVLALLPCNIMLMPLHSH